MYVLAMEVDMRVVDAHSLKDKRRVVKSVVETARHRFGISAAEVGAQDSWQRAQLGFAVVSSSARQAEDVLDDVERFVWAQPGVEVLSAGTRLVAVTVGRLSQFCWADRHVAEDARRPQAVEEVGLVGVRRVLADGRIELVGVVTDEDPPLPGTHAVEDDRRRLARPTWGRCRGSPRRSPPSALRMSSSDAAETSRPCVLNRVRSWATCSSSSSFGSRPKYWPELNTIEVPMCPGMTTEARRCGAFWRKSAISASVNPFTANLAAL